MKHNGIHWLAAAALAGNFMASSTSQAGGFEASFTPEFTWYAVETGEPETDYRSNTSAALTAGGSWSSRYHILDVELFAREDEQDPNRSHNDVREALLTLVAGNFELQAGVGRVFWGVTEAAHVVDVINQDDYIENVDGEDKLGQPMAALKWYSPIGDFSAYVLPRFRERVFASETGRPQLPLDVQEEDAQFESPDAVKNTDYAFRWKGYLGALDFGFSWFEGTARDPRLVPCYRSGASRANADGSSSDTPNCDLNSGIPNQPPALFVLLNDTFALLGLAQNSQEQASEIEQEIISEISLVPHYDLMKQYGLDMQFTVGGTALKLEAVRRTQLEQDFWIGDVGIEHTVNSIFNTDIDASLVVEYLYDERGEDERFISVFDDDVFVGSRIGFNNASDTQFLGGVIIDRNHGSRLFSVEASSRLNDSMLLSVEGRFISNAGENDPIKFSEDEDTVRVQLNCYF